MEDPKETTMSDQPTKYRKKPVVIEARQLVGTLEGVMQAKPRDWIIRGVQGEFYPCKPDIFAATYEPAEAASMNTTEEIE